MRLVDAGGMAKFLNQVLSTPYNYKRIVICAPFISCDIVDTIAHSVKFTKLPVLILTLPETAIMLRSECDELPMPVSIIGHPLLHAKMYFASGEHNQNSLALIGSFNLTVSALHDNVEAGVLLAGTDDVGRKMIRDVETFLKRIASNGRKAYRNDHIN